MAFTKDDYVKSRDSFIFRVGHAFLMVAYVHDISHKRITMTVRLCNVLLPSVLHIIMSITTIIPDSLPTDLSKTLTDNYTSPHWDHYNALGRVGEICR